MFFNFENFYLLHLSKFSCYHLNEVRDKMTIDDLISFLKKKGFRDTLEVLMNSKGHKIDKHSFYNELNKFSYYNSYFRVKEDLIERGLITIEQNNKKKFVKLTPKGLDVYNRLVEINNLINNK
jgi:predicted transcriptional regulator